MATVPVITRNELRKFLPTENLILAFEAILKGTNQSSADVTGILASLSTITSSLSALNAAQAALSVALSNLSIEETHEAAVVQSALAFIRAGITEALSAVSDINDRVSSMEIDIAVLEAR